MLVYVKNTYKTRYVPLAYLPARQTNTSLKVNNLEVEQVGQISKLLAITILMNFREDREPSARLYQNFIANLDCFQWKPFPRA